MKLKQAIGISILLLFSAQNANAAMADGSLCAYMKAEFQGFACDSGGGGIGGGFNESSRFAENSGRGGASVGPRGNARSAREKARDKKLEERIEEIESCKKAGKKNCNP